MGKGRHSRRMNRDTANPSTPETSKPQRPRRRTWKRWVVYSFVGLIAVGSISAAMVVRFLQPQNHFKAGSIPVIASPTPKQTGQTASLPVKPLHDGVFNMLLLGIDARYKGEPARTDTILLVHVNLIKHQYNVLSIPRDTRVYLPGWGETKITHAQYLGTVFGGGLPTGLKDITQAVSNFSGLQINYYAETSFWGMENLVNSIDGIEIYIPHQVNLQDFGAPPIPAGWQHLDGLRVHELVGERDSEPSGDFTRQQYQEEVLVAIAKKLLRPDSLPKLPAFVRSVPKYLTATNMSTADMLSVALSLRGFNSDEVHYYQVPGYPATMMDPVLKMPLDYWIANRRAVQRIVTKHFGN